MLKNSSKNRLKVGPKMAYPQRVKIKKVVILKNTATPLG